jgi:hypothetical protein
MDYFLIFLLSVDVKNYTFLSLNNCNENIFTAMDCLLKLNWAPTIVKKGNTFVLFKDKVSKSDVYKCVKLLQRNVSRFGSTVLDETAHYFPQR